MGSVAIAIPFLGRYSGSSQMRRFFDALASIDPENATGADLLNTRLLLLAASIIAYPLTHIFNLTLVSGNIP